MVHRSYCCCKLLNTAELMRTRNELKSSTDKVEHQLELQQQKMLQREKELQMALQQERNAHQEDVEKLVSERVSCWLDITRMTWPSLCLSELSQWP